MYPLLFFFTEQNTENHSFLLQLLMKCLLEKNGLEEILEDTLDLLISHRGSEEEFDPSTSTLFVLLKELFFVTTSGILMMAIPDECTQIIERESLNVLLKFQRLMFARVFIVTEKDICWPARCKYQCGVIILKEFSRF